MPFTDEELRGMTDVSRVRKIYKLNAGGGGKKGVLNGVSGVGKEENERRDLEVLVLGAMALRSVTN